MKGTKSASIDTLRLLSWYLVSIIILYTAGNKLGVSLDILLTPLNDNYILDYTKEIITSTQKSFILTYKFFLNLIFLYTLHHLTFIVKYKNSKLGSTINAVLIVSIALWYTQMLFL